MEARPNTSIRDLFGEGCHIDPAARDAGCCRTCHCDLGDLSGSEYRLDDAGDRAALNTMRARIFRVHRSVGDGLPACLRLCGRVAIVIAVADRRDRPPEIVMVLGVQHSDDRISEPYRNEHHETRAVDDIQSLRNHEFANEGVIGPRRSDKPEQGYFGLLRRSPRAGLSTEVLELIVIRRPLLALQRNRRARPELGWIVQDERLHVRPHRRDRDRSWHINTRRGLWPVGVWRAGAIVRSRLQYLRRDCLAELDAIRFCSALGKWREVAG